MPAHREPRSSRISIPRWRLCSACRCCTNGWGRAGSSPSGSYSSDLGWRPAARPRIGAGRRRPPSSGCSMMARTLSVTPFWMENAALEPLPAQPLPGEVDVLVIGAGYTGLSAARETAAAGRRTLVLDAGALGAGCSSRNGGQVAYSIKPSFDDLKAKFGADVAFRICREGLDAVTYLRSLALGADCDWREAGCFYGAHTEKHFSRMARDAENQPRGLEQRISVVGKAEQHGEIASDFYHGGCVYHDDACVDPARLLRALLRRAQGSG